MKSKIAILIGSKSDSEVMSNCTKYLDYFGIENETHVLSAHRTPEQCIRFAKDAENNGFRLIIAGAGMAAHLPGVVAAHTILPVIGVPLSNSALNGVDALYSILQMPSGVPVATMAIGKAGAINAAVLAAEILALEDDTLKLRLREFKQQGCRL
ncbi:5-(carboxyamino)imidazole ribonucleotide mutase [candidate division KSB1 bacterium]|nr:5-(carboxyamino)imidazole ribonucleotide mutase [candidate division KSB1 bacterium]